MFGLSERLTAMGHQVIPFAMAYSRNLPSEYRDYFVPPVGSSESTKLGELEGDPVATIRAAVRSIYSLPAKKQMLRLIDDTKPDLIYTLNIVNHMSPSIVDAAHTLGIPVVMRMSDYFMVCPNYLFLRDGKMCRECESGYYHAILHKCVHGSLAASTCRVVGMYFRDLFKIYHKCSGFVAPAAFMENMLLKAGYSGRSVNHIPTFVDAKKWPPRFDNDGYVLYFGRIAMEKGVDFLLQGYAKSGIHDPLWIVGEGSPEYIGYLNSLVDSMGCHNVSFLGKKSGQYLTSIVQGAKYVVVPSMWFDNMPNVVLEAFASGKPVIASALGGICEQVTPKTGILVEAGNVEELASAMLRLSSDDALVEWMGREARKRALREYSIEVHGDRLLGLFNDVRRN